MSRRDWSWVAAGAAIAGAIFGLYRWQANPPVPKPQSIADARATPATAGPKVASVEESTAKLAARLATSGGSRDDWRLLGESYEYLGRKADADAAFASAEKAGSAAAQPLTAVASDARINGTVELAPKLATHVDRGATLFIYAKSAELRGMPLAVLRLPASGWPVRFTLTDSNAMTASRNLSSAPWVTVEARISRSGNALAESGDFTGSVSGISPRQSTPVRIVIDHAVGSSQ